ncbi:AraC family transcriptional regulator [Paenibacillus selenitireducens]|uniref:AraC family transcriptional regulator n=1 Tax=Paenibacillus selenitireducens TaxID=1324314 RepID=A0A1T2XKS4_9BACL|nr:AraC family transcriptional regulator [Paenibacillus selenitireducens]OPA80405.1 AraC family transcriptional regulator [Paenibacillus selenitireducens]
MDFLDFLFYTRRNNDRYIPYHSHACYELVYYFGGSGTTRIGSKEYQFWDRMVALISPGTIHDERHNEGGEVLFIGFHSDNSFLHNMNTVIQDDTDNHLQQLILRMHEEFTGKKQGYAEMLNLMTGELVIHIQRLTDRRKSAELTGDQLQYIRNYMDEHYRGKISIESLARMSGYSYDRFRHLFKETYGLAPLQYVFRKRMEYAKLMLYETSLQVSEIALTSGFSSEAQFCTMFKRETGTTAKAFRRRTNR